MRLCTFREYEGQAAGVAIGDRVVSLEDLNDAWGQDFGPDLGTLIARGQADELAQMLKSPPRAATSGWKQDKLRYAAPYRSPPKIWGIGLNYREHAADLDAKQPEEPASYMRPATTINDPGSPIRLPQGVGRIKGEAEIGVVMGKPLKDAATVGEAKDAVLGFTTVLDVTAEDLLRKNPRYLTRAKSFDTFFSFGPWIVTRDEWEPVAGTSVRTLLNGKPAREGKVSDMLMSPYELVRWHSSIFSWEPGDLMLTGTPGAAPLASGDVLRGEVSGLGTIECPVA